MANSVDVALNLLANTTGFNKGMDGAKFAVNALVGAMAALGVGLSLKELADTADQFATLQARIKIAVGETGNFEAAMAGVYQVAIQTNSNLDSTASLFSQLNRVAKDMGLSQQQALDLTRTINQAVKTGGGSAQSAEAAVTQLIQSLNSGVLRGEEFNSVAEQAPGIMRALAASVGVTTGELRKMAENGELTAEIVVNALREQSAAVQAEYSKFPVTISQALQRISTAWTFLIGEMDQASQTSSSVAQVLVYIADNLGELKRFINDAANGVGFFVGQLQGIDTGTLDALKTVLNSVYEAVKELAAQAADSFINGVKQVDDFLKALFSFMTTTEQAEEGVSGFKKALDAVNIIIGLLRDGFSTISIVVDGLTGAFYQMGASWLATKAIFAWGETKQQFINDSNEMAQKAEEYYASAQEKLMNFQSKALEAGYEAQKTQKQLNAERIADNKQALGEIAAQEIIAISNQAANNERRKQLENELSEARKSGNQSTIDAILEKLAELDKSDDDFSKKNIERQAEKLKAAKQYAQDAVNINNKILSAEEQQHLLTMGFLATQSEEQKKTGDVTIKALDDSSKSAEGFGLTASEAAKRAAKSLGVDVPAALNEVTRGIVEGTKQVQTIAAGFDELKKSGVDASALLGAGIEELTKKAKNQADIQSLKALINQLGDEGKLSVNQVSEALAGVGKAAQKLPADISTAKGALQELSVDSGKFSTLLGAEFSKASGYVQTIANDFKGLRGEGVNAQQALGAALDELLKKAQNQREIDEVRKLYIAYGQDGRLSTQQVGDGLDAVNDKLSKQTIGLDAVSAAFKKFGLLGQTEAQQMSSEYERAFYTLVNSGQASSAQLTEAYQKWQRSVGSSANAIVQSSLDIAAGMTGVEESNHRVRNNTDRVSTGYRNLANAGVAAAQSIQSAWDNTITSLSIAADKLDALTRKQGAATGQDFLDGKSTGNDMTKGLNQTGLMAYNEQQIKDKLLAIGYDDKRAALKAKELYGNGKNGYANSSFFGGSDIPGALRTDLTNTNFINDQIEQLSQNLTASMGGGNSKQVEKTVNVNLQLGGQTVNANVPANQEQAFLDMLKQAKRVS